jgi:hypothetical protein
MLDNEWQEFSTETIETERRRVLTSQESGSPHFLVIYNESGWDDYFADLEVLERFKVEENALYWTLHFRNLTHKPMTLGDIILPLPFNSEPRWDKNVMYTQRVIPHRFVSGHGSFLFWMRPNNVGPYLVMSPVMECPLFETSSNERNFRPAKLEYIDRRGVYIVSSATGQEAEAKGGNWRQPQTSVTLTPKFTPNDEITYVFKFRWAEDYQGVRDILYEEGLFDVHVVPGMTVPVDLEAMLSLRTKNQIVLTPEFPQETVIESQGEKDKDTRLFKIRFSRLGENRIRIDYGESLYMILEFFVTQPLETLIKKRAAFLVEHQQHRDPRKWYNGLFSEWDMRNKVLRSPEDTDGLHRYVLSCDDPGLGKAPYVAAKNVYYPEKDEVEAVEYYIEHFLWGKLQCTEEEEYPYGVYGIPDWKVNRESGPTDREGWTGHVWRVFDYPHVIHLYWNMFRIATLYPNLTKYLDADGYLDRAFGTAKAYFTLPLKTANWSAHALGNFDELVIMDLIKALYARGWTEKADWLREQWEHKVEHFINDGPNLFHSEYPFDPTGFESYQAFADYAMRELDDTNTTLDVTREDATRFMEEEIAANIATRGWLETSYYQLGGERALRYMSQMGGWSILQYGLHHAADPTDYLRLGYASFLSSWALMNAGTPATDYGYWYPGIENDGAAGSAFVQESYGRTWLGKEQPRGPWFYSAEIDLGFGGALRTAATVVTEDPLFGWLAYGGHLRHDGDSLKVIPKDGLRQRLHVILGSQRMHLRLDRDGFARDEPVVLHDGLGQIRFTLENRTADAHLTRLVLSGLPKGDYRVVRDGKTIASITYREFEEVTLEIPASGIKTHILEIVQSS